MTGFSNDGSLSREQFRDGCVALRDAWERLPPSQEHLHWEVTQSSLIAPSDTVRRAAASLLLHSMSCYAPSVTYQANRRICPLTLPQLYRTYRRKGTCHSSGSFLYLQKPRLSANLTSTAMLTTMLGKTTTKWWLVPVPFPRPFYFMNLNQAPTSRSHQCVCVCVCGWVCMRVGVLLCDTEERDEGLGECFVCVYMCLRVLI
jgi:hypothetical protein